MSQVWCVVSSIIENCSLDNWPTLRILKCSQSAANSCFQDTVADVGTLLPSRRRTFRVEESERAQRTPVHSKNCQ